MIVKVNKSIENNSKKHLIDIVRFDYTISDIDTSEVIVDIVDGISGLTFWKHDHIINSDINYFVSTPYNSKYIIFNIYDKHTNRLIHSSEYIDGRYDIPNIFKIYKQVSDSSDILKTNHMALPIYEMYLDKIYDLKFLKEKVYIKKQKHITDIFLKHKIEEGDVVLDVGASVGLFSLFALSKGCKKVYSVEPIPEACNIINQICSLGDIDNIELDECAISHKTGHQSFYIPNSNSQSKSIESSLDYTKGDTEISVNTYTFMDYINRNKIEKIDYLKCDIEGGEYDLFNNIDDDYLTNNISKIVIEYHNNSGNNKLPSIQSKLERCGFTFITADYKGLHIDDSHRPGEGGILYAIK